jgi:hypothetical protein
MSNSAVSPVGADELSDQELLRCAKIATPCYNLKMWERELQMQKDGCLYKLYEQRMPYYNLVAVSYFPNQGILAKSKRSISMNDFEMVAER